MNKKLVIITLSAAICMPSYSFAFGMGDITSGLGDITSSVTGSGGDNNIDDLEKGQGELADETNKVMLDFVTAFGVFSEALGLEVDSSIKDEIANCGSGKICTENELIEKIESESSALIEAMKSKKDEGVKLSADASKTFQKGLVPYGRGILRGSALGLRIAEAGPKYISAVAANPLSASSTLATGMAITKQVPPVLSTFSTASGGIYDFATYNGIEKPEEVEAE